METWFVIVVSLCLSALIRSLIVRHNKRLPPGPPILKSIFLLLTNSPLKFEPILINLKAKYGPFFTLSFGYQRSIFIGSHDLAHQVLVQKGAIFSDRPKSLPTTNISSSPYGPTWRLFRRNLATEVMHPSRVKSFSYARKWVLNILIDRLLDNKEADGSIKVVDHFEFIMFCLMVFMCFGEKLDENRVNQIAKVQRDLLLKLNSGRFNLLTMYPRLGKILFRNRWKEFEDLKENREQVLIPIIKSRIQSRLGDDDDEIVSYVDTLVNMKLPKEEATYENSEKLTHKEMVSMCSEFVSAGSETTSNSLEWIMANLVKFPNIQRKLYDEIVAVVGFPPCVPRKGVEIESVINEEELQKMPFLKAVVLEGLRRHPPVHFVLPHKVSKEFEVQGYVIPQGSIVNFMVGEMGLDPKVWEDPMEFKPERFLANDGVFDISGSKGIKMMPFGAGRRICPGLNLALLHLEYFVANLIWYFHWTAPDGYRVDLSEEVKFTVVMKNPLRACISPRAEK